MYMGCASAAAHSRNTKLKWLIHLTQMNLNFIFCDSLVMTTYSDLIYFNCCECDFVLFVRFQILLVFKFFNLYYYDKWKLKFTKIQKIN
jgi:hypothetical protein